MRKRYERAQLERSKGRESTLERVMKFDLETNLIQTVSGLNECSRQSLKRSLRLLIRLSTFVKRNFPTFLLKAWNEIKDDKESEKTTRYKLVAMLRKACLRFGDKKIQFSCTFHSIDSIRKAIKFPHSMATQRQ